MSCSESDALALVSPQCKLHGFSMFWKALKVFEKCANFVPRVNPETGVCLRAKETEMMIVPWALWLGKDVTFFSYITGMCCLVGCSSLAPVSAQSAEPVVGFQIYQETGLTPVPLPRTTAFIGNGFPSHANKWTIHDDKENQQFTAAPVASAACLGPAENEEPMAVDFVSVLSLHVKCLVGRLICTLDAKTKGHRNLCECTHFPSPPPAKQEQLMCKL